MVINLQEVLLEGALAPYPPDKGSNRSGLSSIRKYLILPLTHYYSHYYSLFIVWLKTPAIQGVGAPPKNLHIYLKTR